MTKLARAKRVCSCAVFFLRPRIAHFAVLEEVLNDMERMLDQRARPGFELLKAQRQILQPALGERLDLPRLAAMRHSPRRALR